MSLATGLIRNQQKMETRMSRVSFIIILVAVLSASCSNMRYLEEDQSLYTGSSVNIYAEEPVKNKKEIRSEIEPVIKPQPNTRFLFWRPRLWFYNIAGTPENSGIRHWIKHTLGRPPVLFEQVDPEHNMRLINNRLFNIGHFDADVSYELFEKPSKTAVEYNINIRPPYLIRNIDLEVSDTHIGRDISLSMEESLIEQGQAYQLERLKKERERIDNYLKERGYFYFHPDYLLFRADTSVNVREVDLILSLKAATPDISLERYRLRNVSIDGGHAAGGSVTEELSDTAENHNGLIIYPEAGFIKPATLKSAVFLEPDSIYRYSDHRMTLNHLIGMGVFKFANIRFERVESADENLLDARIILTPLERKSLSSELSWVSKSNSFTGPGLSGSFSNRNFLGGAESFSINLEGSFESLIGQGKANSTELGISTELRIPRLITPFKIGISYSARYTPRTVISLSASHRNRTDAFSLSALRSQFGYAWNPSRSIQHRYNPVVFNVFSLGTISDEYQQIFSREVLLRRGLFEQFLFGSDYSFFYNSQLAEQRDNDWYFNFNIDVSGNLAWALSRLSASITNGQNEDLRIFGQSFSQYGKTDIDLRHYISTGNKSKIASRFAGGIGLAYGNSENLPYTKLFTIGGSNSIRAFHPRTLGPGTYSPSDTLRSTLNIYQSGDIKLEMNVEYRFDLSNIFKAAVFADAGNIWNLAEKENVPGGKFRSPGFLNQIALGTGAGIRMDFTFFLLRLDLAFPLAIPYSDSNGYFESIRPLKWDWYTDNMILNLAIGYPF